MLKNKMGFTLIEIIIVVAIISILSTIALPSYTTYVNEGRRANIQQLMIQQVTILERQYTRLGGYPDTFTPDNTAYYAFSYAASAAAVTTAGNPNDSATFILTVTPVSTTSQAKDKCGVMSINQQGVKTAAVANCWK